jgi:hypothetical protein
MTACPRCAGLSAPHLMIDQEAHVEAWQCVLCGWIFGEALLDFHHALDTPPEPKREHATPVYDPEHHRLVYDATRQKCRMVRLSRPGPAPSC